MRTDGVIVGLFWSVTGAAVLAAFLVGWVSPGALTTAGTPGPGYQDPVDTSFITALPEPPYEKHRPSRVDVYGNPVDHAVSDYAVDPAGEWYERHSPDTALPELPPPSL